MLQSLPLVREPETNKGGALCCLAPETFTTDGKNRLALEYANQSLDLSRAINTIGALKQDGLTLLCRIISSWAK